MRWHIIVDEAGWVVGHQCKANHTTDLYGVLRTSSNNSALDMRRFEHRIILVFADERTVHVAG